VLNAIWYEIMDRPEQGDVDRGRDAGL
jgi:predicted outer membrane lipoprotein